MIWQPLCKVVYRVMGLFANALDVAKMMQMYLQKELMVVKRIFQKTQ